MTAIVAPVVVGRGTVRTVVEGGMMAADNDKNTGVVGAPMSRLVFR